MPRALAIETSGRIGSIALAQDAAIIAEQTFPHGLAHAAQIIPMIDRLTRAAAWPPNNVDHVYLSIGPGSFTGLRIAVTLAKTLAFVTGAKIVAVPTVRVLVENMPADAMNAIIALDAKRGQVFTASFYRSGADPIGRWVEREPPHLDTLAAIIERTPKPVHLLGEGIPFHQDALPQNPSVTVTSPECWRACAAVVAAVGNELAMQDRFADPWLLTPLYIRLPEVEEKWQRTRVSQTT